MKPLLAAALIAFAGTAQAQSFREAVAARNPIVYNSQDNEVGVIRSVTRRGGAPAAVVQLTHGTLDLGYYNIAIPSAALVPRERGGWYTTISNDRLPYIKPFTESGEPTFFRPSGVN